MKPASALLAAVLAIAAAALSPAVCAAESAPEPSFDIIEYEVEGNTRLPPAEIERLLEPHMGPGLTLQNVEAARRALERAYQQAGWLSVLVDIPEQRVHDGIVRLKVSEGRLGNTHITGAQWYDQDGMLERLPAIRPGQVPDFLALQAQLDELNRVPTRQVRPVLRPGVEPGTLDIEFKVQDRDPVSGQVELHNRHALYTTPWRLSATLRHDNLWQREQAIEIGLNVSPERPQESASVSLAYTWPLAERGQLQASLIDGRSLTLPAGATVSGASRIVGLNWSLSRPDDQGVQGLSLGIEWRELDQQVDSTSPTSTPLRYAPLTLGWTRGVQSGAGLRRMQQDLSAVLTFGLRPLHDRRQACYGTVNEDQFNCSRQGADGGFATLRLNLRRDAPFDAETGSRLALRATGQLALQPLVSSEQLNAGGALTVRGYRDSTASGDLGLLLGLEWRSPELAGLLQRRLDVDAAHLASLQGLLFVDAAQLHVLDALPDQAARRRLAGIGSGLRWRAANGMNADLDLAWPLSRDAALRRGGLPRTHLRMAVPF